MKKEDAATTEVIDGEFEEESSDESSEEFQECIDLLEECLITLDAIGERQRGLLLPYHRHTIERLAGKIKDFLDEHMPIDIIADEGTVE